MKVIPLTQRRYRIVTSCLKNTRFQQPILSGLELHLLAFIFSAVLDVMDNEMAGEELRRMVDAIFNKQFVERPPVFDLIDQVGYFAILAEKSGEATKGTAALFLNKITRFFGDSEEVQNMTSEYFAENITRFRHSFQSAVKQGN